MTNKDREESLTVEEGDQLIREFMDHGYMAIRLQYHASWDELMHAIEKIEQERAVSIVTNNWNNDGQYRCSIYWCYNLEINNTRDRIVDISGKVKIEVVWQAVVEFIQWYNQNKNS